MALNGQACLAMWWDMAPAIRAEFEHWHTHEHFPERLRIPGFRRGSRWRDAAGGEGFFTMYELDGYETLASPAYLERLNAPTPWSARMMPHHRNMVRCQCRVVASRGGAVAGHAVTLRFGAMDDAAGFQQQMQALVDELPGRPGWAGAHLLRHEAPAIAPTTEQKIRGGDAVADWILVATAYDAGVLADLPEPATGAVRGVYTLSLSATPADVAGLGQAG